jgi:hypothetical protein
VHEATVAAGPGAGESWRQLSTDTVVLRDHLEHLRQRGRPLPGDPGLVAAAMGGVLATLAYALLPARPAPYDDDQVIDTVTSLLLSGLRGPDPRPDPR